MLVTPELIEKIVIEMNLFANQTIAETTMMRSSHLKTWKDASPEEIRTFLGLIMYMGLVIKPSIELYWSKKMVYKDEFVANIMTRDRFQILS